MKYKKQASVFYGYLAVVVLIVLLLLYFQQQQKKKTQITNNANVISRSDDVMSNGGANETPQKVINLETVLTKSNKQTVNTESEEALSYMAVYEDLQSARACQPFYRFWREQGLSADVSIRVGRPHYFYGQQVYAGDEKVPLTTVQNETSEYWIQQCYQVWLDYGEFVNDKKTASPLNDVKAAISKKLLSITPKTKQEQKLKQIRLLATQWTASFKQLEAAYEGEDNLEPAAAQSLYDQLETLQRLDDEVKSQWFAAQRNNQPDEETFRDQHFELLNQIRTLERRIKEQKVVNPDSLKQAVVSFQSFDQAMNKALVTKYADVFFEIIYAFSGKQTSFFQYLGFEYSSPTRRDNLVIQHRITPDQMVYEAAGLENAVVHQWELRYAIHLYLCDLGWDCGPQSPIVMNYCLFGGLGSYPDACGQDLPSFYQQYFISPNRWQDVMRFKSLYKDLFYE